MLNKEDKKISCAQFIYFSIRTRTGFLSLFFIFVTQETKRYLQKMTMQQYLYEHNILLNNVLLVLIETEVKTIF